MAIPGKDAQVKVDKGAAGSNWVEVNERDASPSFPPSLLDATVLGDDGMRRIQGLKDASIDLTVIQDPSNQDYKDLRDAADDGSDVAVEYIVDRTAAGGSQTIFSFTGKVSTFDPGGTTPDGLQVANVTIENSDGQSWSVTDSGTAST